MRDRDCRQRDAGLRWPAWGDVVPEYIAPGGYVEETSSRSPAVESVATSTLGLVGATQYGPVPHPADAVLQVADDGRVPDRARRTAGPQVVTSFSEYQRLYG